MNKDLISRSALIAEFERIYETHYKCTVYQFIHDIFKAMFRRLKNAPAVDAVEVVHGEWRWAEDGHCKCTVCGQYATVKRVVIKTNFCPNCGANMDIKGGKQH